MSLGLETLAIALCVEHGDDEEAQQRIVAMAMDGAFESLGAVTKYADEVTGLTYANKLDIDSDFKVIAILKEI